MKPLYFVYFLSNPRRTTLYLNATADLCATLEAHKQGVGSPFTRKYVLKHLIYFETFCDPALAEARYKQLKNWHRDWKWNLITAVNPMLYELYCTDAETSSASTTHDTPQRTHRAPLVRSLQCARS